MMTLLAIIGLIVILHFVSKGLIRLGTFLENLGEHMEERSASNIKFKRVKKDPRTKEKIHVISGEGTDEEFKERVRKEIDELTGDKNG